MEYKEISDRAEERRILKWGHRVCGIWRMFPGKRMY